MKADRKAQNFMTYTKTKRRNIHVKSRGIIKTRSLGYIDIKWLRFRIQVCFDSLCFSRRLSASSTAAITAGLLIRQRGRGQQWSIMGYWRTNTIHHTLDFCTNCSGYDFKVPREPFEETLFAPLSRSSDVINCSVCAATHKIEQTYYLVFTATPQDRVSIAITWQQAHCL